ncbi:hypothetical protein ACGF3K_15080 [Streptomyces sp. NPDC047980]|uniref:hypothetical protein n=1 Tax=unclassified Streptomyces TaxID=2593676 RepID=UPI0036C870BD
MAGKPGLTAERPPARPGAVPRSAGCASRAAGREAQAEQNTAPAANRRTAHPTPTATTCRSSTTAVSRWWTPSPSATSPTGSPSPPDGSRVHVTDFADDEVSVIGTHSDRVVDRIEVGDGPTGVATPGRRAGPTGGARRPPPHARDEPARALSSPVTAEAYGPDGPRSPASSRVVDWDHDDG